MSFANTPYDDVFRTLLNDCSSLIIPLINEVFGEHYTGKERIVFSQNEHFMNRQDGDEEERITDTSFKIIAGTAVCWCGFLSMIPRLPWMKERLKGMSLR